MKPVKKKKQEKKDRKKVSLKTESIKERKGVDA
jgi:hypothetical protein